MVKTRGDSQYHKVNGKWEKLPLHKAFQATSGRFQGCKWARCCWSWDSWSLLLPLFLLT
ncbi:hypothetical protein Mapa_010884 [Marchantia paleacea]|nr:hypothetical protein Mapa_010884 [Marchantia paleacea]